jgi:O-antigen/teichoic acid export membrane protein
MPFVVHHLGDRTYGYWVLIATILGYYGVLDLGIVTAVQFQVAKALGDGDKESANRTISTATCTFAVVGIFILLLTLVVALMARSFIANVSDLRIFRIVLIVMGVDCAVGFPGRAFIGALSAHLRFDLISAAAIATLALRAAFVFAVIGHGAGIVGLAFVNLITDSVGFVLTYFLLQRVHRGLRVSLGLAEMSGVKELFHYSKYALIVQVSDQVRFSADGWVVGFFVGVVAVTHYGIATRLSQSFLALMIAIVGILAPWFSQLLGSSDFAGIRRIFILGTKVSASAATLIACSLIIYGKVFIAKWMGANYIDAFWPLAILVAAIFCDVSQLPSVSYMYGVSRHKFLAAITLSEAVVNFALSIYLARRYGMIGVALGSLVPMAIAKLLIQPAYVCGQIEIPLGTYYFKMLGRAIFPPALCALAIWYFVARNLRFARLSEVCLAIGVQAAICAVVAFYSAFDERERDFVIDKIRPRRKVDQSPIAVHAG